MTNSNSPKTNFHTHTNFCDGHDTPEEVVKAAIEKDFSILGFSGHSMYPFSSDWHIQTREHAAYASEIRRLEKVYKDKIDIRLGFEADYISGICAPRFDRYKEFSPDFLIGSVHYVYNGKGFFEADGSPESITNGINNFYDGNTKKAVCEYFSLERGMLKSGDFSILGHADLIRKSNGTLHLFDENDSWYKKELKATAKEAARAGVIAEINTGAISRGYMKTPYPSDYFLSLLFDAGVPITIDSDAHSCNALDCAFDDARERAKKTGYKEFAIPQAGSIKLFKL